MQQISDNIAVKLNAAKDGGNSGNWSKVFPPSANAGEKASFYAPIVTVAVDGTHTLAAFGASHLWITADWGGAWQTLPSGDPAQDVLDGVVTALAWASPKIAFAATFHKVDGADTARVWRFDQTGTTWGKKKIKDLEPPASYYRDLAVENAVAGSFYASTGSQVMYFNGTDWTSTKEPFPFVNSLVVDPLHPEQVYAGSDIGVFKATKTATGWDWGDQPFGDRLPEVAVASLAIHPVTRMLRAGTY